MAYRRHAAWMPITCRYVAVNASAEECRYDAAHELILGTSLYTSGTSIATFGNSFQFWAIRPWKPWSSWSSRRLKSNLVGYNSTSPRRSHPEQCRNGLDMRQTIGNTPSRSQNGCKDVHVLLWIWKYINSTLTRCWLSSPYTFDCNSQFHKRSSILNPTLSFTLKFTPCLSPSTRPLPYVTWESCMIASNKIAGDLWALLVRP